ncbi:hypothetical protein TNCV_2967551 [Trichonephila clavipes]|nr:hypothetical protein TNCV_2967551 [Trichonephila clavipes]
MLRMAGGCRKSFTPPMQFGRLPLMFVYHLPVAGFTYALRVKRQHLMIFCQECYLPFTSQVETSARSHITKYKSLQKDQHDPCFAPPKVLPASVAEMLLKAPQFILHICSGSTCWREEMQEEVYSPSNAARKKELEMWVYNAGIEPRGSQSESMFTVPSIQSESNLLASCQKTQKLSTQMKNHSHASGFHRSTNRRHATQQNGKHHFCHAQHHRLSR